MDFSIGQLFTKYYSLGSLMVDIKRNVREIIHQTSLFPFKSLNIYSKNIILNFLVIKGLFSLLGRYYIRQIIILFTKKLCFYYNYSRPLQYSRKFGHLRTGL